MAGSSAPSSGSGSAAHATTSSPAHAAAVHAARQISTQVGAIAHSTGTAVAHHAASTTASSSSLTQNYSVNWVHEFGALLIIVGVMWLAARYMKRRTGIPTGGRSRPAGLGGLSGAKPITVLARQTLGKGVSLAIVHVASKDLLIGVTPSGVTLLSEIDPHGALAAELGPELETFAATSSVEDGDAMDPVLAGQMGGHWKGAQLGGASPLQAWMAKLDGIREMTVRRS